MYLAIIFLTLISSLAVGFFGRFFGFYGSAWLATSCLVTAFLVSIFIFYEVVFIGCHSYIKLASWLNSGTLNVDWGFMFDSLTTLMCCVVTFISCLVHIYSIEYLSHDPHLPRFLSYISLFTFFMLILVASDNFIQMFVGWEGVGLCSYLLINFWFTRIQANKAAIKAMVINRVGDFSLIIGTILIFIYYKSVDYATVAVLTPFLKTDIISFLNVKISLLTAISIFLFIGAVGKSAQLGLHTWLPDAMEAPTPVSALIHAATMVTAGVFLLARASFIYEYSYSVLGNIAIIGALTAFFASTIGLFQNDLKRVIAYSTCSQLGYMVFACGLSNYTAAVFHLSNHAFFKALLFLSAGSIIHAVNDEQDMRKIGGLKKLLPFTYNMVIIGSLALIGFPFLTGFYSKDLILELAFSKFSFFGYFSYYLGAFGAFCTAFYSTRLLCLTFLTKPSGHKNILLHAYETPSAITLVLGILSIFSVFVGFYSKDMLVGMGSLLFDAAIYIPLENINFFDCEFIDLFYKLLPVFLSLLGSILSFVLYVFYYKLLFIAKTSFFGKKIYNFFNRKWFFDKIYNEYLAQFFFKFSFSISYKFVDRGIFELLGPTGFSTFLTKTASDFYRLQTSYLYHYTYSILVSITFFLSLRELWLLFEFYFDNRFFFIFFVISFFVKNSIKTIREV